MPQKDVINFGGGGSSSGGATSLRTTATNRNAIAYSANSSSIRHQQYRIKKYVPANATWSGFQLREINIVAGSTNENTASPGRIVRRSIKHNNTFHPVTWNGGASYVYLAPGASATSDTVVGLTGISGVDIEECGWNTYNLKYDTQTVNFTVGQTVTGGTSGATGLIVAQTDAGATGSLALINETGTWADNEAITDPLGGAAVVDLTNQSIPVGVGTQDFWLEGNIATNVSPATGFLAADPVTPAVGTPVITAGNITGVTRTNNGASYTSGPSLVAWEETSDGQIFYKSIGYAFFSAGSVTGVSITSGTPPSGLAAWTSNAKVTFTGGGGFGQTTSITASSEITAIPSTAVKSLIIIGDSVARGFSSTDGRGDIYHNYGYLERAVRGRCGLLNVAISSLQATSWANYASFYPITMAWILQGNYTHCKIHVGINDATAGRSESNLQTDFNNIAAIHRPYGTKVAFSTILNGTTSSDSFATEANQTVRLGCGLNGVADLINAKIRNNTIVSDWAITDARLLSQGVDPNKWAVSQSWTTDGLHFVAYAGIARAASGSYSSLNTIA